MPECLIFFPKSGHLLRFSKRAREASPLLPNCASVSGTQYASISLNIPKYSWKCLNKMFWLCQSSGYAWSSYTFNRLLKMYQVLNKLRFRIWLKYEYVYARVTQSSKYAWLWLHTPQCLNMHQYALMSFSMPEHRWILFNVPEYAWNAWINCFDNTRVFSI